MQNPFEDLVPAQGGQGQSTQAQPQNPFSDLVPQASANVPRGPSPAAPSVSPSDAPQGWLDSISRHLLANAGSALQNTVKNINFPRVSDAFPKTAQQLGAGNLGKVDLYKGMGINKGILDDLSQGTMEFLPYLYGAGGATKAISEIPAAAKFFSKFAANNPITARIGGEATKNVIANDAMALNQGDPNNTGSNLLYGTATGVAAPAVGYGLGALRQYGAEKVAQSAIPGLTKKATDYMRNLLDPNDYTASLKGNFKNAYDTNTANWNMVDKAAADLDNAIQNPAAGQQSLVKPGQPAPTSSFDNSPYLKHIDDYVNNINQLEPARRAQYSQALDFANQAREMAPQSVQGAVAAHKNLNQALSEFMSGQGIPAANRQAKEFVSGLKDNLKQNMSNDFLDQKMQDLGYNQSFSDIWNKANQSHQNLQEFYKSPDKLGNVIKNTKIENSLKGPTTEGNVIGQYAPKPSQTGTEGLDQLANNMGSKSAAQDAVKAYMNRRPLTNGVSTLDVSNEYAKLSPAQRDWIYGDSPEGKYLDTVNNVRQAFGKEPSRSLLTSGAHHAISFGVPAAMGYFGSEMAGGDRRENLGSAAAALGLTGYGKFLARRISPGQVNWLTNYAKGLPVNPGRYMNIAAQAGRYGGNNQ